MSPSPISTPEPLQPGTTTTDCDGPSCMPARVEFVIAPALGTTAPTVTVTVHNLDSKPLPMVDFDDAACFSQAWLAVRITDARGKALAPKVCKTPRARGHATPIAAGATLRRELPLASLYPTWKRGVYRIEITWDPRGIRASHGADAGFGTRSTSQNLLEFTVAESLKEFTIRRDETAALPGGAKLHFLGHSHKSTEEGQDSPLLVNGTFSAPGKPAESFYASLLPGRHVTFEVAPGHAFELLDWDYDVSMRLRYLRY